MGSYIMHLCISDAVKNKLKLSNKFVYGSILPDILKNRTGDRENTHYLVKKNINGENRDLPDIEEAKNNLSIEDKEVRLGYIAHLAEDYIWFNNYIPTYAKILDEDNVIFLTDNTIHSRKDFSNTMYEDYHNTNKYLIEEYNLDIHNIKDFLKNFLDIESFKILDNNTNFNRFEKISNNKLLTKSSLDDYINKATNEVEKVIKEMLKG